jgi:hypothetical protein
MASLPMDSPAGYDPAAPYGRHPITGEPYSDKQKIVAGLLQLFAGGFGAGRFYLGHNGIGVAQLLTCGGLRHLGADRRDHDVHGQCA